MAKTILSAEQLRELLDYNPDTGIFVVRVWRNGGGRIGAVAGCRDGSGYLQIMINRTRYSSHRLAWMYVTGAFPVNDIDHINGVPDDNRFANLRDVTKSVNLQNQKRAKSNNKTGFLGVSPNRKLFRASISIGGKCKNLGSFKTAEEAGAAYLEAKRIHHAGCTI